MKYVFISLLLVFFASCSGQQKPQQTAPEEEEQLTYAFKMPEIPAIITEPLERADYLVKHYWDNFDFSDTAYVHLPQVTEQAFVDYIDVMQIASYPQVVSAIKDMLKKAEADTTMYYYFTNLYEKYLYDPNSPFRNDEFFIPALEFFISSPASKEKVRPMYLLELAKRNRVGEKAANFTYTLPNGKQSNLYSLVSDYTLIFFYNPGCNACEEIMGQLKSSLSIGYLMKENRIKILAVYPDEDLTEWKNYLSSFPKEWINSYDKGTHIMDKEIYDLKAIPTLFLLDKDKKVILKDTSFDLLENLLRQKIG